MHTSVSLSLAHSLYLSLPSRSISRLGLSVAWFGLLITWLRSQCVSSAGLHLRPQSIPGYSSSSPPTPPSFPFSVTWRLRQWFKWRSSRVLWLTQYIKAPFRLPSQSAATAPPSFLSASCHLSHICASICWPKRNLHVDYTNKTSCAAI